MKKALITGITGQDGSYLAELLLSKGYEVHGLIRPASTPNTSRIRTLISDIRIHHGDLSDSDQVSSIIRSVKPDEVYNLAAQSNVGVSIDMPDYTGNITGLGTARLLEAIHKNHPEAKFYQASSSEMFGDAPAPQDERTPYHPLSPYGCAKLYAYWMVDNYRFAYNMFGVNGILFNHESPRRGEIFVTRKVTMAIANILAGKQKMITLGSLDAYRDWGYAPEYVEIMWKMLQQDHPDDYIVGTGEAHTVFEFVTKAFEYADLNPDDHIKFTTTNFGNRGARYLKNGSTYAHEKLGWKPRITFNNLIKIMIDADMRAIGLEPVGEGDAVLKQIFPLRWWKHD